LKNCTWRGCELRRRGDSLPKGLNLIHQLLVLFDQMVEHFQ
jgi:hypothetical protein